MQSSLSSRTARASSISSNARSLSLIPKGCRSKATGESANPWTARQHYRVNPGRVTAGGEYQGIISFERCSPVFRALFSSGFPETWPPPASRVRGAPYTSVHGFANRIGPPMRRGSRTHPGLYASTRFAGLNLRIFILLAAGAAV